MTIFLANLLYLITIVLVVVAGSLVQTASLTWGLLFTEFCLILLPALLLLRLRKLPLKETLRWRWPGWGVAVAALAAGVGVNAASTPLSLLSIAIFGYTVPLPLPSFSEAPVQAGLFLLALLVAAPLCEEVLFRGAIQDGYAKMGKWAGIFLPAVLFTFYHLRLQGLIPLIPLAIGLGWVLWRTQSLPAAMLFHAGANAIGGVSLFLNPAQANPLAGNLSLTDPLIAGSLAAAVLVLCCPGILLAGLGVFAIHHKTPPPVVPPPLSPRPRFKAYWPLIPAALIYIGMAGFEFITFKVPGLLGQTYNPTFSPFALEQPLDLTYEVQTPFGSPVGEAACTISPANGALALRCTEQVTAFDVTEGTSRWVSGDFSVQASARWDAASLYLLDYTSLQHDVSGDTGVVVGLADGVYRLAVTRPDELVQEMPVSAQALLPEEWPWRLMALDFEPGRYVITTVDPSHWNEDMQQSAPILEVADLTISGPERVTVPAGDFKAWKVVLELDGHSFTAWYEQALPHRLVKLERFLVVYVLK